MSSSSKPRDQPFADDAGVAAPVQIYDDPYRALDELMAVVEELCPVWPERGPFVESGKMLL